MWTRPIYKVILSCILIITSYNFVSNSWSHHHVIIRQYYWDQWQSQFTRLLHPLLFSIYITDKMNEILAETNRATCCDDWGWRPLKIRYCLVWEGRRALYTHNDDGVLVHPWYALHVNSHQPMLGLINKMASVFVNRYTTLEGTV